MWYEDDLSRLSLESSLEEVLRFLFSSSITCIFLYEGREWLLITKEELITFMEAEAASFKIRDLLCRSGKGKDPYILMEKMPPFQKVLFLTEDGGRILRVIDMAPEKELFLPSWWEAPFPLVAFHKNEFYLNEKARELFHAEIDILRKNFTASLREEEDSIFSCISSTGEERRFFVKKVQEHIFTLEDVSSEVHMAQDIVWWAAVGNALNTYLQAKGVEIRSFQEGETLPKEKGTAELIPCRWENELLGYIQLSFEEDMQGEERHHEGQTHSRDSL